MTIRSCARGIGLATALLTLAVPVNALPSTRTTTLGDGVQVRCAQNSVSELECGYRLLEAGTVTTLRATIAGIELPTPHTRPWDPTSQVSAIMILVDTSDPARETAVRHAVANLRALLRGAAAGQVFGLAAFDRELTVLAPIGTPVERIVASSANLHARGKTTELYRNALRAVDILARYPAARRALVIYSDGLAEDRAYYRQDVVRAARARGVAIFGFGYPRSVALSVGLQSLRRLADESGGLFFATGQDFELPAEALDSTFATLNSGGRLQITLDNAKLAGLTGKQTLHLAVSTDSGTASVEIPVRLPDPPPPQPVVKVVEVPKIIEVPKVVEVQKIVRVPALTTARTSPTNSMPDRIVVAGITIARTWLPGLIAGAIALPLLALALFVILKRRAPSDSNELQKSPPLNTFAYLETQDGTETRYPIGSVAFRIGRHADNDLVLRDPSISRHHAEIHRRRDGSFTVTDLESLNGVFVNSHKCTTSPLADQDKLEVGDVLLRFGIQVTDDPAGEETVILRTVMPRGSIDDTVDEPAERSA